ncbi:hypothetical protein PF004_g3968 [Phytophthora fragariae]|uniref:Peptidase A2 domain-containing protein n=1 Tax=Phytophthora fragariae TaxID=53985 RepID=A0A6G0PJV5_9STRA|nr:hypothetical protein PF004_g3968 [Phytophthora fragariae]
MRNGEENEERKSTPAESSEDAAGGKEGDSDATAESAEDSAQAITSAVMTRRSAVTIGESTKLKLLPGERLGWWSSRKFDRRIRMRALVMGAVNNEQTKILLDTGANVSAVTESFARKLRLKRLASADLNIDVRGIGKTEVETTIRAMVKVTLGWEIVYEFEVWIMDHHAGVDVILGTDFMIPAGIRLDLYNSKAKLPDEIEINLIKSASAREDTEYGNTICGGPTETVDVASRLTAEFKLQRRPPDATTHELWARRVNKLVPTVRFTHNGRPSRVLLTNTGEKPVSCPAHFPVVLAYDSAIDRDLLKKEQRLYAEWLSHQPAAVDRLDYETPKGIRQRPDTADGAHHCGLSCAEQWERLERLQAETEQPQHNQPSSAASRDESELDAESDESEPSDSVTGADDRVRFSADHGAPPLGNSCPTTTPDRGDGWDPGIAGSLDTNQPESKDEADQEPADLSLQQATQRIAEVEDLLSEARALCKEAEVRSAAAANAVTSPAEWGLLSIDDDLLDEDPAEHLRLRFLAALTDLVREEGYQITAVDDRGDTRRRSGWEHTPTRIQLDDFAHELAFLPDLTTAEPTVLDYDGDNVRSSTHSVEQYNKLVKVLRRHANIMISSGNALPPPAYGVVCDIDVQDHDPIKQRARRVPLKHLEKLYELLKGLLKAGLVAFSNSPWASPIVIVLKKNGIDIRLCIDYKMVNAITVALEYAMPLVDDLLTELESYLWFCSLDAASGFWAVMMTSRVRRISAFVCALGHFEWLRMPFGLKNAPVIYQRLIDNALWGYVQPKGGWTAFAERMCSAESAMTAQRSRNSAMTERPGVLTKFEADYSALATSDPVQALVNGPDGDMFSSGEPDESSHVPVFGRRSSVDDICLGGVDFDDCLETLDRLLTLFAECRISVSFTESIFVQPKVDFLSHVVTPEGISADPKKLTSIAEIPFP